MRTKRHERKPLTPSEYKDKVSTWLRTAKQRGATHVIVALDVQKNNPFPVYVPSDASVQQKIKSFNDNSFVRAIEVYNMNVDLASQLSQGRAWNV